MNPNYAIPGAIILSGFIVAGSIIISGADPNGGAPLGPSAVGGQGAQVADGGQEFGNNNSASAENLLLVDEAEHILGNKNAPITIVEYSDFECPFCGRFHPTLERIVEEYPDDVRWVYRHLPLTQIHPQAVPAAHASECVAEFQGNDAFWSFTKNLFEHSGGLSASLYRELAAREGVTSDDFEDCMSSRRHEEHINKDMSNAFESTDRVATPLSFVIDKNGNAFPFHGALPFEQVKSIVEDAISS
jgi:protein-disulfide isomerase